MIEEGKTMTLYKKAWAKDYMKLGFETIFEGNKCFAVNLGYSGNDFFDGIPEGVYDIFISFAFDGTQYVVSMYSKTVDVSLIAKKYDGGGHKMAAGFHCKDLLFKKRNARKALVDGFSKDDIYVALDINHNCTGFIWFVMKGAFHSFPYLHIIAVKKENRKFGIGKKLLQFFEDICFIDYTKLFLVVADFNPDAKMLFQFGKGFYDV